MLTGKQMSVHAFKDTIVKFFEDGYVDYDDFPQNVRAELLKVSHGNDFFSFNKHAGLPYSDLLGLRVTINDIPFLGCQVGGADEFPIFFILYIDARNALRAYIPRRGNVFDKKNRSAYKVDNDDDEYIAQIDTDAMLQEIDTQFGG